MATGYLIGHINIHDKDGLEEFKKMPLPDTAKYGGKALMRNPSPELGGGSNDGLAIVLEFESIDHVKKFCGSEDYSAAKVLREKACSSELVLVEGI